MERVTKQHLFMALDLLTPYIVGLSLSYSGKWYVHYGNDIVFSGTAKETFNFLDGVANLIYVTSKMEGGE